MMMTMAMSGSLRDVGFPVGMEHRVVRIGGKRVATTCCATSAPPLPFEVRRLVLGGEGPQADVEIEAASWTRAVSFHRCPPGREYSGRLFQAAKAAEEGAGLALRVRGQDPWYGRVQTLLATAGLGDALRGCDLVECVVGEAPDSEVLLEHADPGLNAEAGGFVVPPGCLIPSRGRGGEGRGGEGEGEGGGRSGSGGGGGGEGGIEVVLGSLDVNLGKSLAGEWLAGDLPVGGEDVGRRVYLSNVCALPAARRRGVAQRLVEDAKQVAVEWGVDDVYVHAVADNAAARALYERLGFVLVKEETQALADRLKRPRRVLFHCKSQ